MSMIKEEYFTPGTIQGKSREFLASVMTLRQKHAGQDLKIHEAALLVLDMQRYFLDPSVHAYIPSGPAILPGIQRLVRAFEEKKRPVILTRHLNSPTKAGQMGKWWKDLIREESPFSQVTPELESPGRIVIHKNQYDAFYETPLEAILQDAQVEQVVISGVMTHLCCETTARSAFMRGFEVFVAIDGMATYNHAFHQAALLNLSHGFAYPLLVDEIEELICEAG